METSTASPSSASSHLIVFVRLSCLLVAVLVLVWGLSFRSNFISHTSSSHDAHIYSVLHYLVMVIGFVLISGEAILVHKWCPGSRNLKKLVHLTMQGVALASGTFGIWTNFHLEKGWFMGFFSIWHHGEERTTRIRVLPGHVFLGLYIYALAIATAETGLLEKLTFLEAKKKVLKHSLELVVVNSLGLGIALLSGVVILTAVSPGNQSIPTKIVYPNTSKRSSS
ncbi:hypothetical protein MKX01_028339 [Papaver californicum]|nr:hypothetical protein MKX01_028339 [Papaver californicum]